MMTVIKCFVESCEYNENGICSLEEVSVEEITDDGFAVMNCFNHVEEG